MKSMGRSKFFGPLLGFVCLAFLLLLSPDSAQAAKISFVFSGLSGTATAKVSSSDVSNGNWLVNSFDKVTTQNKSLSPGTYTFTVQVTAGSYAVSTATATAGTINASTLGFTGSTSHTSSTYHDTYEFLYTVTDNATVTLTFVPRYTLTGSVNDGSYGGMTVSGGIPAVGTTYWAQNETATVTVSGVSINYGIDDNGVSINGTTQPISGYPKEAPFSTKIQGNTTISATFVRIFSITPVIDYGGVAGSGTILPSASQAQRVKAGGSATLTATATAGSKILKVNTGIGADVNSPASPYSYTYSNVNADYTFKAWFTTPAINIKSYCITPPFLSETIKPNLLLMLDNSGSMYDLAYNNTVSSTFCYDNSFNKGLDYYGNFDYTTAYSYNSTSNKFVPGSAKPGSCAYSTDYFCIATDGAGAVTSFWATGSFLNWLSASKIDQLKTILTGGKYDTASQVLISESRGCLGRRFIKEVPDADWVTPSSGSAPDPRITFGIRGPNAFDLENVSQTVQGGKTRIEIFKGKYNATACNGAVVDWSTTGSIGDVQYGGANNNTSACIGSANLKSNAYNHVTHLCYKVLSGDTQLNESSNNVPELNPLKADCEAIYATYNNDPGSITNENGGDAVCSSSMFHTPYDGDQQGYIGQCWVGGTWIPEDTSVTPSIPAHWENGVAPTWDNTCAAREVRHFCYGAHTADVTDPTDAAILAASGTTTTIVPSFIMDAGLSSLTLMKTALATVGAPTPPKGLINEFADVIGFGIMQFNRNGVGAAAGTGSSSECSDDFGSLVKCPKACGTSPTALASPFKECFVNTDCPSGTTCQTLPKLDGAKIPEGGYIGDPLGDHSTGMINLIDSLTPGTWTPLAEGFYNAIGYFGHRNDMRLNYDIDPDGAYDYSLADAKDPSKTVCRDNYTLILSDGGSTVDWNHDVNALAEKYPASTGTGAGAGTCSGGYEGSKSLDDLVYLANTKNIRHASFKTNPTAASAPGPKREKIITYVINTGTNTSGGTDQCMSPSLLLNEAAKKGGTGETAARDASDYPALVANMKDVFSKVASRITSGTAASILSNSEGSGANLLQAIFYPLKTFDNLDTKVKWIGELQNFWYYIDPFIGNSTVREDTNQDGHMNLKSDWVAQFTFNKESAQTEVYLTQDTDGNGLGDTLPPVKQSADAVKSLWRAGRELWSRSPGDRKIYTQKSGTLIDFTGAGLGTSSSTVYRDLLQTSSEAEANALISYVRGGVKPDDVDDPTYQYFLNYRSREVALIKDGPRSIWKLGDIISSTPRVQSSNKLNMYHLAPPAGYGDSSYDTFASTTEYRNRGMAYVGANDGMLHAFKAGKLTTQASGDERAILSRGTPASAANKLGREEWAFVPKNALPYLTYLTDPGYPHLDYVDGTPTVSDVTINGCGSGTDYWNCSKNSDSWKTVVIGGMGLGGAAKTKNTTLTATNSVKSPLDNIGLSSYFALDVTNQTFDATTGQRNTANEPSLLWEFQNEKLGYATSGPAIVRIAAKTDGHTDNTKNGRWFAVFGSGPTGPIDVTSCQFQGQSDQTLKLFVVDLNPQGELTLGTNYWIIDTGIENAFAGSISGGVIDVDRWNRMSPGFYQDDAVYVGYVTKGDGTWNEGGVLRLSTREQVPNATASNWSADKVIDGIGPVTSNISRLQDRKNHNLWLYFGTGRYFFNGDDMDNARKLYGIKDQCYTASNTLNANCTTTVSESNLTDQSGDSPSASLDILKDKGWYIELDGKDDSNKLGAERSVTDVVAMTNGAVFYTTYKPSTDACQYGGNSRMWGVKYDTGGKAPDAALQAKALVQISTGEFKEIDLGTALNSKGYRTMGINDQMTGKPPGDPPPIVTKANLKPVKKILHIQEH